jgi:hypothetical protein
MRKLWPTLLLIGCLFSLGCPTDLLRLTKTGPPSLPELPQPTSQQIERRNQLVDLGQRMLEKVYEEGAPSKASAVGQAAEGAALASAEAGKPASRLPLPPPGNWDTQPVVDKAIKQLVEDRADLLSLLEKYRLSVEAYSKTSVTKTWSIGLPFIFSSAGLLIVFLALVYAVKTIFSLKSSLYEIFLGVRDFLGKKDPAAVPEGTPEKKLLVSLSTSMDSGTKELIKKLYAKVGD